MGFLGHSQLCMGREAVTAYNSEFQFWCRCACISNFSMCVRGWGQPGSAHSGHAWRATAPQHLSIRQHHGCALPHDLQQHTCRISVAMMPMLMLCVVRRPPDKGRCPRTAAAWPVTRPHLHPDNADAHADPACAGQPVPCQLPSCFGSFCDVANAHARSLLHNDMEAVHRGLISPSAGSCRCRVASAAGWTACAVRLQLRTGGAARHPADHCTPARCPARLHPICRLASQSANAGCVRRATAQRCRLCDCAHWLHTCILCLNARFPPGASQHSMR
jgi:hypothetical protein